jgi:succinate dehydrogenase / fumarate reductase cytochrome b subunit
LGKKRPLHRFLTRDAEPNPSHDRTEPAMAAQQRPLSPHLQIYRQPLTAGLMSITHRATGVLLAFGAFALTAWLLAVAGDNDSFSRFMAWASSPVAKVALLAVLAALVYHFLNGLRHLLWDIGWGYEIPQSLRSGHLVLGLTLVVTALIAFVAIRAGGGA